MLMVSGCGKEAKVKDKDEPQDKAFLPSEAEVYFKALKDIEAAINNNDREALEKAIFNHPEIDLNQVLTSGETFLIMAIQKNFPEIQNLLIEKGARLSQANINKETPLMVAVKTGSLSCVRFLLEYEVELDRKNNNGETALHIALKSNAEEIALTLIKRGANLEVSDKSNKNALRLAEENSCNEALELIKSIQQVEYGTPDLASFRNILVQGDVNRLNKVLSRYPNIAADYESINPLALLVDNKDQNTAIRSATLLLDHKANVNGPLNADITPLIAATTKLNKGFVNLFLSREANPQLQDKEGKSALIHAVELNDLELVDLLLSYSAVEKYTFRKNGEKVTYNACSVAKNLAKKLTDGEAKKTNKAIQKSLDCGFLSWLF